MGWHLVSPIRLLARAAPRDLSVDVPLAAAGGHEGRGYRAQRARPGMCATTGQEFES
jgi:hypothetical protein